jgi:hypothetical protein
MSTDAVQQGPLEGSRSDSTCGWTPRSRFEAALAGELPDRVPFGVLENVPHNDTLLPLAQAVWDLGLTPIAGAQLPSWSRQ